ncbi:hypothetical protein B0H19DRAFT_1065281 [Mycena capillaripes]|nr:hypothetical protein B0H19DRAFT_1065281 [Mycena capillaripes]
MPIKPTDAEIRLDRITRCLMLSAQTLRILASGVMTPFLEAISNTTQSLLTNINAVKRNKDACAQLLEKTHQLLEAIILVHINSSTGGEFPPGVLAEIGRFTQTLYKIHTFVEAQQGGNKVKIFFRQSEMSNLLKDSITEMEEDAHQRQQEVINMIEALSEAYKSDGTSLISGVHSSTNARLTHTSKLDLNFNAAIGAQDIPWIAILGAGGMGKTTLAKAVIHQRDIILRYEQFRHFVACDTAANKVELAGLIGAHLGLKPGKDLTQPIMQHFSNRPPSLLILDNLETVWEPSESHHEIEEFLSLLSDFEHLALMVTMRGAERPAKVRWSRPFLPPLEPLDQDAAHKTFIDIADGTHEPTAVDKVLSLTDNMPLAISLRE